VRQTQADPPGYLEAGVTGPDDVAIAGGWPALHRESRFTRCKQAVSSSAPFAKTPGTVGQSAKRHQGRATLMRDKNDPNVYTLSFRSTEYWNASEGGDWERDGRVGAAGLPVQNVVGVRSE